MKHKSSEYGPLSALDSFEKDSNCPKLHEMHDPNILNSQDLGQEKVKTRYEVTITGWIRDVSLLVLLCGWKRVLPFVFEILWW